MKHKIQPPRKILRCGNSCHIYLPKEFEGMYVSEMVIVTERNISERNISERSIGTRPNGTIAKQPGTSENGKP